MCVPLFTNPALYYRDCCQDIELSNAYFNKISLKKKKKKRLQQLWFKPEIDIVGAIIIIY